MDLSEYFPKHLLGPLDSDGLPTDYSIEVYGLKHARKLMNLPTRPQGTTAEWASKMKQELVGLLTELGEYIRDSNGPVPTELVRRILLHSYRPSDYTYFAHSGVIDLFTLLFLTRCASSDKSAFSCESGYACFRIMALGLGLCLIPRGKELGFDEALNIPSFASLDLHELSLHINGVVRRLTWAMEHIVDADACILGWSGGQKQYQHIPLIISLDDAKDLLIMMYKHRRSFLATMRQTYSPGLSTVIFVLWRYVEFQRPLNDQSFDKQRFDTLREVFWRCWLVATHEQELFMNLAGQIEGIRRWSTTEKHIVSDENDLEDSNELIAAFIDRLTPPRDDTDFYDHLALVDLKCCLAFVQEYIVPGCREHLPQCFGAIIERLWYIITSGREGLGPMSDVLGTVIGWFREMEELSERPTETTALFLAKLIHQMIETDFLSLIGRIVFALVPSMDQSRNSRNFANNARFLRGTEGLFENIAKVVPSEVLAKCFKQQGIEWWKVNDHIELLSLAMIPQDKPRSNGNLPSEIRFYEICSEVWKSVGNCIQHTINSIEFVHRCAYRRCPDPIIIEGAVHECLGCHRVQYCSARCQALDWMYDHGAKAHHGVCVGSK